METKNQDIIDNKNLYFGFANEPEYKDKWDEYKEQRLSRGFDDTECWNLNTTFAKYILPRLKVFEEHTNLYPPNMTNTEWHVIINKMITAFEYYVNEDETLIQIEIFGCTFDKYIMSEHADSKEKWQQYMDVMEERGKVKDEGFELFGKYFQHLWW